MTTLEKLKVEHERIYKEEVSKAYTMKAADEALKRFWDIENKILKLEPNFEWSYKGE